MKVNAKVKCTEDIKRKFVIEKLKEQGIQEVEGVSLQEVGYDDLKHALVMSAFREIDITVDANRWY